MNYDGKQVKVKDFVAPEGNGQILAGQTGYIEGNWHKMTGHTFNESINEGNTAAIFAMMRVVN